MNRRRFLKGSVVSTAMLVLRPALAGARNTVARLAAIEREHGGRLGVAMLDTHNGHRIAYRGDERFLLCSTYKLLLVATVLRRVDAGLERLERRIVFGHGALLDWAPVTRGHVGSPGMTVAQLCSAAITISDNTAANLLLADVGGPAIVTVYLRSLGDSMTRLDRTEPTVNRRDGDKDTTTPQSMLEDMQRLLLADALSDSSRDQLLQWLRASRTGGGSLRAGLPPEWPEGDKAGSGDTASNDVAIMWPPYREPLIVTAYYESAAADDRARKATLAAVGRVVAEL